jgi:hypothetical protein
MMNEIINCLLQSEPWIEYCTRLDLLNQSKYDKEVIHANDKMISHPQIRLLLSELTQWSEEVVTNHKNAGLLLHKLAFIAEVGLTIEKPEIREIVDKIMKHKTREGVVQVQLNIPEHFGGTGQNSWAWSLCDAPLVLYSLIRLGLGGDSTVNQGLNFLRDLIRENGWPCSVSPELGKFRGPGRKDDPCPYATLLMLKVLSQINDFKESHEAHIGAECLLNLWARSKETHPYMFYMGTDFRKLKAPLIWYDIVHVADTLTQFEWLKNDTRLKELIDIIKSKANEDGSFTPESEWKAWKGWDFGQKKKPSQWLTFLILRIIKRFEA